MQTGQSKGYLAGVSVIESLFVVTDIGNSQLGGLRQCEQSLSMIWFIDTFLLCLLPDVMLSFHMSLFPFASLLLSNKKVSWIRSPIRHSIGV